MEAYFLGPRSIEQMLMRIELDETWNWSLLRGEDRTPHSKNCRLVTRVAFTGEFNQ